LLRKEEQVAALPTLPDELMDKPPIKVPNKHIIPAEAIIVNKELGTGEFGVVQQGVWTNDGERVCSMSADFIIFINYIKQPVRWIIM
jgi:hypothetical protein